MFDAAARRGFARAGRCGRCSRRDGSRRSCSALGVLWLIPGERRGRRHGGRRVDRRSSAPWRSTTCGCRVATPQRRAQRAGDDRPRRHRRVHVRVRVPTGRGPVACSCSMTLPAGLSASATLEIVELTRPRGANAHDAGDRRARGRATSRRRRAAIHDAARAARANRLAVARRARRSPSFRR